SGTYEVNAVFDQVNGLVSGAKVEAAGVRVGKVTRIELGSDGLPHVRLRVDSDYRLRRGATAEVRFFSVAGELNRYVALTAGAGPELSDGATLGVARTDQPVEIDQVLSTLDPATRRSVRGLLAGLDSSLKGRGADISATLASSGPALNNTASLLADVNADGAALKTAVSQTRVVVGELARDPGALSATADRTAALLATTARRQSALRRALPRLGAAIRNPRVALDRLDGAVGDLRALVSAASPGVAQLVPAARELSGALRAGRPALAAAASLTRTAPADLRRLSPLLGTAKPVLKTLDPVLRGANPILDNARVRLPDFFSFFSNWADFTSNYDAAGHAARVGLVFAPAPLRSVGPGEAKPGHLLAPFLRLPGVLEGEPWTDYEKSFVGGGVRPEGDQPPSGGGAASAGPPASRRTGR
ncbi:MAG: MlaD family protein, partial [Actinobacteria bacterium]|nr:MlaD family protein [Actinomycetota bacterium]